MINMKWTDDNFFNPASLISALQDKKILKNKGCNRTLYSL